jgi:hypothetical protein
MKGGLLQYGNTYIQSRHESTWNRGEILYKSERMMYYEDFINFVTVTVNDQRGEHRSVPYVGLI